jgi:hypothetical protein
VREEMGTGEVLSGNLGTESFDAEVVTPNLAVSGPFEDFGFKCRIPVDTYTQFVCEMGGKTTVKLLAERVDDAIWFFRHA